MGLLDLPDSKDDRKITFTIPKKIDAYFSEYYKKEKRENETPEAFVLRKMCAIVTIDYVQTRVIANKDIFEKSTKIANNDLSTFLIENGLE